MYFHFRHKTYAIKFRFGFSLLCLFLFCLCITLGIWQLHRYHFKKILLTTYENRLNANPRNFNEIKNEKDLQFQSVNVRGTYLNKNILLQNRFYHDELGFEVLTPFQIAGDKTLLMIDRGWVKKTDRQLVPSISIKENQEIKGHLKLLNEYQFILGKNILDETMEPIVAQRIDLKEMGKILNQSFYPFILLLNADEKNGFVRDWTITTVPPARHLSYAIQWFLFAMVLLIAYVCFCCEEVNNAKKL